MKKNIWILFIILVLASFLRLYKLNSVPPSPYWEEAALGYDAYSIAKTGKDHHGNSYPIIAFPSFGDYKPSGYFYAVVPFIKVLGLHILAVRLPSAIAGIIAVGLLYLIGRELFGEKVGLLAAFVFAIQPWAIQFSRGGWEVNLAMTLLLGGAYVLLKSRHIPNLLPGAVLLFALSMYTYHAARLFAPIMGGIGGLMLLVVWKKEIQKRLPILVLSFLVALAIVSPFILNLQNKTVSSRFTDTSIFSQLQPILDSNAAIESHGNTPIAKVIYHRYWYFGKIIVGQWASHFSPSFLFIRGDGNYRHWNGMVGELYWAESIFILCSLLVLVTSNKKRPKIALILLWILLAAVAPALVTPAPHALRFLFAAPGFALLAALGMMYIYERIQNKRVQAGVFLIVALAYVFSFSRYHSWYMIAYPVQAASDWQYGYEELYSWIAVHKKENEQVYITREQGRPAMYYLFYSQYDPVKIQQSDAVYAADQLELLRVDDYHFVDTLSDEQRGLIATSGTKVVVGGKIIKNILDPQRNIVWVIWRRE